MKLAVMQPYLFPYIGYYQLINSADVFILYDDVSYIKNGYINRNRLKINGESHWFTLPAQSASCHSKISEVKLSDRFDKKLKTSIQQNYSKAPFFDEVYPLFCRVLDQTNRRASFLAEMSLTLVLNYLGINTRLIRASDLDYNRSLPASDRLIALTRLFECNHYINSIGGKQLYDKSYFLDQGIQLSFLRSTFNTTYDQGKPPFVPNLSFLDQLMWCSKERLHEDLESCRLE